METLFSKTINHGPRPSRLFVGGIHGKEGYTTILAMKRFEEKNVKQGRLKMCNFPESPYISTLDREYFDSKQGRSLLSLIKSINPTIYLELHCYHRKSHPRLTSEYRKEKSGVPSLLELDEGVLIGSISPIIRSAFFKKYDFPFILEIPCHPDERSLQVYLDLVNIAASSDDRFQILEKIGVKYPQQVAMLRRYFVDFSDNFLILFQKTSEYAQKNGLYRPEDLEMYMKDLVKDLDLELNQIQLKQVAEAALIFQEHE
jgi:hypothetical protein